MIKTLAAYLTLNEIEPQNLFLDAGEVILSNPTKKLVNLARKGFVLVWFQEFVAGKIALEEYMLMGDVGSTKQIYPTLLVDDIEVYLATLLEIDGVVFTNELLIVDQKTHTNIEKKLRERNAVLLNVF